MYNNHENRFSLSRAQEIMWEAWDEPDKRTRLRLARQALKISKDCADAYVLLALDSAKSIDEAMDLYKTGMKAGERVLGKKTFKEEAGFFWGILETRPYMRARLGFANCLRDLGNLEEAVKHYKGMIRLNPNDNQGIRDILIPCLIILNRDNEAKALYRKYKDDYSAAWAYSKALMDYRSSGNSPVANKSLVAAYKRNKYIPIYLFEIKKIPKRLPEYYSPGDTNEAIGYAHYNLAAWKASPGALEWFVSNFELLTL
ncbi:MAG: hypothetical protein ACYDFU_03505 [Nitrospirota bacterium]